MPAKRWQRKYPGEPFGRRHADGRIVFDASGAAGYNAIVDEVERLGKWTSSPPFAVIDTTAGREVSARPPEFPPYFFGQLSGTASPYTYTEGVFDAAGTFSAGGLGRSGTAYEVNALPNLNGKIAQLYPIYGSTTNEVMFRHVRLVPTNTCDKKLCVYARCCTACGATNPCPVASSVWGCFVPGVTVTIKDGGGTTIDTGTTDANGKVCWTLPPPGNYTASTSGWPAGYNTPADQSFTIPPACNPVTLYFDSLSSPAVAATAGSFCACCCKAVWPTSSSFTLTDSNYGLSTSLTWQGASPSNPLYCPYSWAGCIQYTNIPLSRCYVNNFGRVICYQVLQADAYNNCIRPAGTTANIAVFFSFTDCGLYWAAWVCDGNYTRCYGLLPDNCSTVGTLYTFGSLRWGAGATCSTKHFQATVDYTFNPNTDSGPCDLGVPDPNLFNLIWPTSDTLTVA